MIGLDAKQRAVTLQEAPLKAAYTAGFIMPAYAQAVRLETITAQDLKYNFEFFYPSNGKVPGSPIPRSGQVSPRPV